MTGMQAYIDQLEDKTEKDAIEKVAFNVRLEAVEAFKLTKLAEKFDRKKSSFAADILKLAIEDAWSTAGMENIEKSDTLQRQFQSFLKATKKTRKKAA